MMLEVSRISSASSRILSAITWWVLHYGLKCSTLPCCVVRFYVAGLFTMRISRCSLHVANLSSLLSAFFNPNQRFKQRWWPVYVQNYVIVFKIFFVPALLRNRYYRAVAVQLLD